MDRSGKPFPRLCGLSLAAGCEGEPSGPVQPPFHQPFVRPWPEAGSRWVGTPFVPTPPGGCGAQRRARAAPLGAGTGPARSHAQPPLGGEHGEHGEDPPLARSEHRGTCCCERQAELSTAGLRAYARRILRILRIQGFRDFKLLIHLRKTPRPPTDGVPVPTDGVRTPDRWGADPRPMGCPIHDLEQCRKSGL